MTSYALESIGEAMLVIHVVGNIERSDLILVQLPVRVHFQKAIIQTQSATNKLTPKNALIPTISAATISKISSEEV